MNDNYMKTILSGVKEWTENLTDDAIDKANNALEQANKSIDKALYVVNITKNDDGTYSADKTFEEIFQAYNEGKYSIVATENYSIHSLSNLTPRDVTFSNLGEAEASAVTINARNKVYVDSAMLATEYSKLPNPYPLTFTGAVNETYDGSSAKTIEIPSGGVHSDYNQNDSTAADYIKNRPFYTGDPVETVLVEERTVPFTDSNHGFYVTQIQLNFVPTVGEVYKVSWDGTVYESTCVEIYGKTVIGNLSLAGAGSDTGEPFVMTIMNGSGIQIATSDTSASHTFSISRFTQEVVKIDEKYLPESAFTNAEWTKISNKIVDYKRVNSSLSVVDKSIHALPGNTYSDTINTTLIFENGKVYRVSGSLSFTNTSVNKIFTFNIDVTSTVSNYNIYLGSFYDDSNKATVEVYLYSSNHPLRVGVLSLTYDGTYGVTYTFSLDITVNEEATVLPDICLSDSIQRVGGDIIIPSSTPDSTKKFKITVDDSGTIAATEVV